MPRMLLPGPVSYTHLLMAEALNAPLTASVQWLERTLDDSANRRLSLPEGFLCADAILRLCGNVTAGLHVNDAMVAAAVQTYLPFIATENLMMEGVKRGGDRQKLHEIIRTCSMEATAQMKQGLPCDLLERLAQHPDFPMDAQALCDLLVPEKYTGRCGEQVERYVDSLAPLLADVQTARPEIEV